MYWNINCLSVTIEQTWRYIWRYSCPHMVNLVCLITCRPTKLTMWGHEYLQIYKWWNESSTCSGELVSSFTVTVNDMVMSSLDAMTKFSNDHWWSHRCFQLTVPIHYCFIITYMVYKFVCKYTNTELQLFILYIVHNVVNN